MEVSPRTHPSEGRSSLYCCGLDMMTVAFRSVKSFSCASSAPSAPMMSYMQATSCERRASICVKSSVVQTAAPD